MYPLLALSILTVTMVVERAIYWLSNLGAGRRFNLYIADISDSSEGRSAGLKRAASRARNDRSPLGTLIRTLHAAEPPITEGVALGAIESLRPAVERATSLLSVVVAAAPLLGILGTVTGIIQSFDLLGAAHAVSDPVGVAGGIAEALYTTAFGLIIALTAVFPNAIYRAQAERTLSRLESLAGAVIESK